MLTQIHRAGGRIGRGGLKLDGFKINAVLTQNNKYIIEAIECMLFTKRIHIKR